MWPRRPGRASASLAHLQSVGGGCQSWRRADRHRRRRYQDSKGSCWETTGARSTRLRVATPTEYRDVAGGGRGGRAGARGARRGGGAITVGVGTPGFLQPASGLIRNANLLCLNDRPLDKDLEQALGRPVRVANDAKCFVLSEAVDGAAAPPADSTASRPDVVFGATLGTGVGGGIVVDGRVLTGRTAPPPSGATPPSLPAPRRTIPLRCFCGHPGCIESFISGRGLEGTYRALGGSELRGERDRPARRPPVTTIAARAFALYEDRLARALASVINLVDPRAIAPWAAASSNNDRIFTQRSQAPGSGTHSRSG